MRKKTAHQAAVPEGIMRHFLFVTTLLGLLSHATAKPPNFLLIFADDHGYGDVSAYRESDVRTPNIDGIGRDGLLFTAMRANCTVCSPSRAALLTGRYPDRAGVPGANQPQEFSGWVRITPGTPARSG
jgi:arylsulfatase A-like enzyme